MNASPAFVTKWATTCLLLVATAGPTWAQPKFWYALTGRAQTARATKLYVRYDLAGVAHTDSFLLTPGPFAFRRSLAQPVAATLSTNDPAVPATDVFLANERLTLRIGPAQLVVETPSAQQQAYRDLVRVDSIRRTYFPRYGQLNARQDTAGLQRLGRVFDSLSVVDKATAQRYVRQRPATALTLLAFTRYVAGQTDVAQLKAAFAQLPRWAQQTPDGQAFAQKLRGLEDVVVGRPAPVFTQADTAGKAISLQDFWGKYVLLDFWASWCGPCRQQHPALKALYANVAGPNFEILAISLDSDRRAWARAIRKDALPWPTTSDLRGFQNVVALQYGVQVIPYNVLIGPDGRIVALNLHQDALRRILAERIPTP